MNAFTYSYPVKVYFGEKAAEKHLKNELAKVGANVLLAYGGGSIRKNGVYDELIGILKAAGWKPTWVLRGRSISPMKSMKRHSATLSATFALRLLIPMICRLEAN